MVDSSVSPEARRPTSFLFLPSLVLASFAINPLSLIASFLLVDIAVTFESSVGVVSQLNTCAFGVSMILALVMGLLSDRYDHKLLLLVGLIAMSFSCLGSGLASSFGLMFLLYSLSGIGLAMVNPMTTSLVGDYLQLERRAGAIGLIMAAGSVAYLVGAPVSVVIAGTYGWRGAVLFFAVPVSVASLTLAVVGLPSAERSHEASAGQDSILISIREVFSDRSAASCLLGTVLRAAQFVAIVIYGPSFFRQRLHVSAEYASLLLAAAAFCYTVGSLGSGYLVNRLGRKRPTVLTAFLAGVFTISYAYVSDFWISVLLNLLASWFSGALATSAVSLTLEQVPRFRGTMMSINSAAASLGNVVGGAVGGLTLLSLGYEGMGGILGLMGISGAVVYQFLTMNRVAT